VFFRFRYHIFLFCVLAWFSLAPWREKLKERENEKHLSMIGLRKQQLCYKKLKAGIQKTIIVTDKQNIQ